MHPHGVRYTPDYDGVYLGDHTRVGGFIAPGEEFTYTWEATPDSVGVWPYHDHGPNHTLNTFRGAFGAIVIRERGAKAPDVEQVLFLHQLLPPVTGLPRAFQAINGRTAAGNTPTIQTRVGQDVALHVIGMDNNFHDFHIHGHRWKDAAGAFVDTPTVGPNETITARFVEDNPGRWLYHCHVFSHQDGGHGRLVHGEPMRRRSHRSMRFRTAAAAALAAGLLVPAGALAQDAELPRALEPGQGRAEAEGQGQDPHRLQAGLQVQHDPGGGQQVQGRRHRPRQERHVPRGRLDHRRARRATSS